jgi:hypothetical protein
LIRLIYFYCQNPFQNRTNTEYQLSEIFNAPSNVHYNWRVAKYCPQEESMKNRVITRERGVIPGCIPAGRDSHMAVDGLGRPWIEVAKLPSTIDAWLAALHEETRQSRIRRGRDPETGELIEVAPALRPDLTAEQRVKATRIGRIRSASAAAKRKPKEAMAA